MDPLEIYRILKDKIIWLDLAPGVTLNQIEIAQEFGVSRNPVIIALTRLDADKWVIRQGSHYVVSLLTLDQMRNITEIRSVLESQANIWAMNRITPDGLKELIEIEDKIKNLSPVVTKKEMFQLDYKFHCVIYRESHNIQLYQLLTDLLCQYIRFWLSSRQETQKEIFFSEAIEIIQAISTVRLRIKQFQLVVRTSNFLFVATLCEGLIQGHFLK